MKGTIKLSFSSIKLGFGFYIGYTIAQALDKQLGQIYKRVKEQITK